MRRLKQTRVKTYHAAARIVTKDSEGVPGITFGTPYTVKGYLWPATSKRQAEEYGDRINNIANMRIEGGYTFSLQNGVPTVTFTSGSALQVNDGIYVHADTTGEPDYQVISITEYEPLLLEVERRV